MDQNPTNSTVKEETELKETEVAPPTIVLVFNGLNDINVEIDSRLSMASIAAASWLLERLAGIQFTDNIIAARQQEAQQAQHGITDPLGRPLNRAMRRHGGKIQ